MYGWVWLEENWWATSSSGSPVVQSGGGLGACGPGEHITLGNRYISSLYHVLNALEHGFTT